MISRKPNTYQVVELFSSINGEGPKAGELATFIRFKGCNLNCNYCDTTWANEPNAPFTEMTANQIVKEVMALGNNNVTLTGGEPLLRDGIFALVKMLLARKHCKVEIETNGSIDLNDLRKMRFEERYGDHLTFTMDYKLPGSGMESNMCWANLQQQALWGESILQPYDTVKFVVSSEADLERAYEVIISEKLDRRCNVYLSPAYKTIEPLRIVEFMKEKKLNGVRLQLQLHKVLWNPNMRGV